MKWFVTTALLCLALYTGNLQAQSKKDTAIVRQAVMAQQYNFEAQIVTPLGGRLRNLDPGYDVRVTKDAVIAYLPYFGRAYAAPADLSSGGIKFTSKNFDYSIKDKKGGWDVLIKPKDVQDVQQLSFSIFYDGTATLNINNTVRQAISYSGYITAPKEKKK